MVELLRGMAALDILDLGDLWAQRAAFAGSINLPRIEYAHETVVNRKVCPKPPAGLPNDQIMEAQAFAANPTPLLFEHDLTGSLPVALTNPVKLAEMDFTNAARQIQSTVAAIMAVAQVEAG